MVLTPVCPAVVSAHLIVHNRAPELLNEVDHFFRIFRFVEEPSHLLFV